MKIKNPRMALAAHLEALMNGTCLLWNDVLVSYFGTSYMTPLCNYLWIEENQVVDTEHVEKT